MIGMRGIKMTDDLIRQLMAAGLTKQQATSVTAETLVHLFMDTDGKLLIQEAQHQVDEMRSLVRSLQKDYDGLKKKLTDLSDAILAIADAQEQYGAINDEKAKTILAMYAALLSMNERAGADPEDSVKNAGYVMYAYLGGQARRDITVLPETHEQ